MHLCLYVCMFVCMYVCMHACMHAWMDGRMDGWMDGWMDLCSYVGRSVCMYTLNPEPKHTVRQWACSQFGSCDYNLNPLLSPKRRCNSPLYNPLYTPLYFRG